MRTAVYCRVSTEDQAREGSSLDSQQEACLKAATEQGYEVSAEHLLREVYSGLTLDRPEISRLRDWVRDKEVDAVIVYSTDRLSRDPVHLLLLAEEFDKAKTSLIFVTEPLDNSMEGQLLGFVRGWASKLEAVKIRERSMRGRRTRALSGKLPSGAGVRLFAYNYLPGRGLGEGVRYVNEEEARWVREVYRWYTEDGLSMHRIAVRLRSLGVQTPSGKGTWHKQTIHKILSNQAYVGKTYVYTRSHVEPGRHYKPDRKTRKTGTVWRPSEEWIEIPSATPAIISEDTFEAAQARMKRNKELSARNGGNQYLLSGFVFCRHCGRRYRGQADRYSAKKGCSQYLSYRCPNNCNALSLVTCHNRRWSATRLESVVWIKVEELLTSPELVIQGLREVERHREREDVGAMERTLETLEIRSRHHEKQKDRILRAFYLTGDEERFKRDMAMVTQDIKDLERQRAELNGRIIATRNYDLDVESIKEACDLVRRNLGKLDFQDKRMALEALQVKVWIDGMNVSIEGAIPIMNRDIASSPSTRIC